MTLGDALALSRPLVVLDLETTSLEEEQARIVEVGLRAYYPLRSCAACVGEGLLSRPDGVPLTCEDCNGSGRRFLEWSSFVDPQVPIPASSSETTGITDQRVKACKTCGEAMVHCDCAEFKPWPTFAQLAPRLARLLTDVDFAGKHVRYDLRVLSFEMRRAKVEWSYKDAAIVDADRVEQALEPRDLSTLYRRRTGKEPVNAHRALADVAMTDELLCAQLEAGKDLPRTPRELHDQLWAGWIDVEGKFKFDKHGNPLMFFGKHRGARMQDVPLDYWTFILKSDFSDDVKQIARDAKLRKFPEMKR